MPDQNRSRAISEEIVNANSAENHCHPYGPSWASCCTIGSISGEATSAIASSGGRSTMVKLLTAGGCRAARSLERSASNPSVG